MNAPPGEVDAAVEAVTLSAEEAGVVAAEARSAAQALGEPLRSDAERLALVASTGVVPPELVEILAEIVGASLKGGRARRLYRAEGEKSLLAVLLRTPQGRGLRDGVEEVNASLTAIAGRRLDSARVTMRRPGSFTLNLQSEGVALTLALTADAVSIESLTA